MHAKKVAVVTGATHGLGEAICNQLAGQGFDVVLIARSRDRLAEAAARLNAAGHRALSIACDVSDRAQVVAAREEIGLHYDHVDVLVNNAGIPAPRTFEETDFESWDAVLGTNLTGAFYLTRALWDALAASGSGYVINISGTSGRRGGSSPAYGSAKFGLTGLTRAIAASGRGHNIRSTVLYPGAMDTGWRGAPIGVKPASETMDPDEVARYVGYLISTPKEFVINESVLNPVGDLWL